VLVRIPSEAKSISPAVPEISQPERETAKDRIVRGEDRQRLLQRDDALRQAPEAGAWGGLTGTPPNRPLPSDLEF
jgi:hypothetical protein